VDLFGTYKAVFLTLSFFAATGIVVAIFIREDIAAQTQSCFDDITNIP